MIAAFTIDYTLAEGQAIEGVSIKKWVYCSRIRGIERGCFGTTLGRKRLVISRGGSGEVWGGGACTALG